jgi:hypothetical protein
MRVYEDKLEAEIATNKKLSERVTQLETLITAAVGALCDPDLDDAERCEQARELLSEGYEDDA